MQNDADIEYLFLFLFISFALGVGHKPLRRSGHCRIQESQHGNSSAHNIENTEIGSSETIEYETGRI